MFVKKLWCVGGEYNKINNIHEKLLDSVGLRAVQFKYNTIAKSVTPVQKCNTSVNYTS